MAPYVGFGEKIVRKRCVASLVVFLLSEWLVFSLLWSLDFLTFIMERNQSLSDLLELSARELKAECKRLGLSEGGRKAVLAQRILEFDERNLESDDEASEGDGAEDEMSLRMRVLESALQKEKEKVAKLQEESKGKKRRRRKPVSSSSEESSQSDSEGDDSSCSSSEESESDDSRRRSRKADKKKRKKSKVSVRVSSKRKWRTAAYEHQYALNKSVKKQIRKASAALRKQDTRKAKRALRSGERIVEDRQEWLLVADYHGYETANRFSGVGELMGVVSCPSKRKRLDLALASAKKPFRSSTPGVGRPGRAQHSQQATTNGTTFASPELRAPATGRAPPTRNPEIICLRCHKKGHIARMCTEPSPVAVSQ